jgi:hypothetical protein
LSLPYQRKVNVSQRVYKMRSFQENVSIFNDNKTNIRIQISELNELREQLRKALEIAAPRSGGERELNVQHIPEGG